ncbi:hypothetical protein V2G26_008315 [Clonostachys chloroleuca]
MIVDNADNKSLMYGIPGGPGLIEYLPVREDGLILLTTRTREISTSFAGPDVVELECMNAADSEDILEKSLIKKRILQDKGLVTELLEELTYLPLAIVQAAAYFNKNRQLSLKRYLNLLKSAHKKELSVMSTEFFDPARYNGTPSAILSTWLLSFDQILETVPSAADLLMFMAWVEPRAIPRSMLPGFDECKDFEDAIGTLCGYSFISQREDDQLLDMHRLVHLATQSWMKLQGRTEQTTDKAVIRMSSLLAEPRPNQPASWRLFLPHGLRLLGQCQTCPLIQQLYLRINVVKLLLREGRLKEVEKYFLEFVKIEILEDVVSLQKQTLAEGDPDRLLSESELAVAYQTFDRSSKAAGILEHLFLFLEQTPAEDDFDRQAAAKIFAAANLENDRIKKADDVLEHIVSTQKQTLAECDLFRLVLERMFAAASLKSYQVMLVLVHQSKEKERKKAIY